MVVLKAASIVFTLLLLPFDAAADGFELSGFLGAEMRVFVDDAQFRKQFEGAEPSLMISPELRYRFDEERQELAFIPFARLDSRDDRRTHFDIREAYWRYFGEDWEVLTGFNIVFWGVTESQHLVNIINQVDAVEDIDDEEWLGQPMINVATQQEWGRLSAFVLPGFRERTFPGKRGRLRTALPVDQYNADYDSSTGQAHTDFALRYSHVIEDWDFGGYYFYGTAREPRLLPNRKGNRLIPHYDLIHQVGIDVQFTRNAWLWKFEGIARSGHGNTFGAVVGGFEYTLYQIFESAADLGLLAEYDYDGRDKSEAPITLFDNDIFVGTRLALNDPEDTSLLFGALIDCDDQTTAVSLEAERRLFDRWKGELETRWFFNVNGKNPLSAFRNDSYITLRLLYSL